MRYTPLALCSTLLLATGALVTGSVVAQDTRTRQADTRTETQQEATDAQQQVSEATRVVAEMKRDPELMKLLSAAQGIYIVPDFGKGAAVVGGRGGQGVLLVRQQDEWSQPAFFNFGRISIGAQAGGAGGSIAMLLMTDEAVGMFKSGRNNFSLDADAGLTVIDYSTAAQAVAGQERDVIVWSDTQGLFAGAAVGVTGIYRDDEQNRAYYRQAASTQEIFAGRVSNPHAEPLRDALPERAAAAR